jgi:uncharacterized membrane protein (UPF0136 family)
MTRFVNGATALFALICIGLGIQAYFLPREGHTPSMISLVASCGIGVLCLVSLAIWKYLNPRGGRIMTLVICVFVLGRFIPSWLKTGLFYPHGVMTLLALGLMAVLLAGHFQAMKEKRAVAAE